MESDSLASIDDDLDTSSSLTTEPFPLTAAQRGLWFAQHLMPDVPITIANYIDVSGELDHDLMNRSVRRAATELGAGSLRVIEIEGEPHQYVDIPTDDATEQLDFSGEPDPERAALDWMREEYSRPVDLVEGPLIKAATVRISDSRTFWYSHVHHLALDGYGAVRLMNRAAEIYSALDAGEEPSLSKAGALEDVYAAENGYRSSSRFEKDRRYWIDKTTDLPAPVGLAGIVGPPAPRSLICGGPLPETVDRALTRAAERLDSAFAPVAVAAVAAFLSRLTGSDDIVLSLPVAARTTALLRHSGGMVSNVLPIRVRIDVDTTVASLVDAVQLELTGALRHQRYRAEDIRRDAGGSQEHRGFFGPAINIMAYERVVRFGSQTGHFNVLSTGPVEDLSVNIYPPVDGSGSRIEFEGNPNLYTAEKFEDLHRRFVGLLARFLADDPELSVMGLDVLDPSETAAVVPARGGRAAEPLLLPDILAAGVRRNPHGTALVQGDRTVTYTELDAASNAVARALVARGARPDSVVAVALPRSIESVVAFWAVAKSGAAFVPVDPAYPAERIAHMVGDSGVLVGLATVAAAASLPGGIHWLALDDPTFADELSERSREPLTHDDRHGPLHVDHAAYMIYTSGSTGTPKGVLVTHRGLSAFTADERPELRLDSTSRLLRFSSSSFDASIFEMLAAFSAGASMVVAPADVHGGSDLTELLARNRVSHIVTAPALLGTVDVEAIESLTTVVVGGDVCPPDLVERLRGRADLHNSYGPTESTIVITMTPTKQTDPRAITIGTPLQGASAVVLDRWLRPVPVGVAGELYVGGPGLARGYHNRAALTSTRFVADPYGSGTRLYRTGDIVRWRRNIRGADIHGGAELEFVGRRDFQVQLHGLRVELGEIDVVLSWHQAVDFAVSTVIATDDRSVLVSYVTIKPGHSFDSDSLVQMASEFLPPPMIPVHIVELDSVPLTPSGKVDRSALPDPMAGAAVVPFRGARTDIEHTIADAMAEVLGRDTVGIDDSFFALGGDSIVAIQLVSRAKSAGVEFTPRDVFERRTVAALAEVAISGADRVVLDELPGGGVGSMPLLPIAAHVVRRAATPSALDSFYQALVLTAPDDLDNDGLVRVVATVLETHDVLRSQLVGPELDVRGVDPSSLVSQSSADDLDAVVRQAGSRLRPRDGVMIHFVHVTGSERRRLVVVAHHLVIDGVSWRILVPDLASAWAAVSSGSSPVLAPVGTSMRRWAHAVHELPSDEEAWRSVLGEKEPLLGSRPLGSGDVGSTTSHIELVVPADVIEPVLGPVAAAYRMGPEDALVTALTMALSRWRDARSHLILVEGHGRDDNAVPGADLTRTVGWFTTAHPVRVALAPGVDVGTAIKTVKEQRRAAAPSSAFGYGLAQTRGLLDDAPTPQISFNYLGRVGDAVPDQPWMPDLSVSADAGSAEHLITEFALDINAAVSADSLTARIGFPTGVLGDEDVRNLAGHWADALREVSEHDPQRAGALLTPSDVPLVEVDQNRLDRWHEDVGTLDDVWPLAPLQRGLLFHAELTAGAVDVYTAQITVDLGGTIDVERLHRAVQRLLDRHSALRTAFAHDSNGVPVQLVHHERAIPWRVVRSADTDSVAAEDRGRRFDMTRAPLLRATFVDRPDGGSLVLTNHHIVFDGWSMPILIKDLLVLYAADGPIPLPPRPYRDYLHWLGARDQRSALQKWTTALAGATEPTLLAESPVSSSALPADIDVHIDGTALARLATSLNVTVNTVVQTAWSIVLTTVLSRHDVVFGATVSGRPAELPGATEMVGLFINTLPLRVQVGVRDTVAELAEGIQQDQVNLLDVHHVGLADIQAAAGPGAAFDTLAVFESYPVDHSALESAGDIAGMAVRGVDVVDSTHYPLTLVTVLEPTPTMTLRFDPGAFSEHQVATFAERLQRILLAMAAQPTGRVRDIDVLGDLERRAVTHDWISTRVDLEPVTLDMLLQNASSAHRSDTCAVFDGRSLTYENFSARVNCLTRYLISRGVGPESVVGVSMPRSMDQLVAIHAVVHAGAAYLPLDPSLPAARIAYMIDTAGPLLVLGSGIEKSVPVIDPCSLDLSGFATDAVHSSERTGVVHPGSIAYVIFTSGSTGRPKGVAVSHASIVNRLLWMQETYPLDSADVVLHKTPTTFDVSVWELFWPHLVGARTVIAEPEGHRDPKYLGRLVHDEQVTTAHFVPSMLDLFLDHADTDDCTSLRQVFASGEALSRTTVRRSHDRLDAALHNLYGPTEAAVDVTYHRTDPVDSGPVPIGVPVWNTGARVLDSALRTVPIGTPGELYLSGVQLARGYTDRSPLTAHRFVADPFTVGNRLYRTGDLVRWTLAGELQYLGRNDFQVKLRGQRLELGEIEEAILQVPSVTNTVVTVHRAGNSERLVAYLVGDAAPDVVRAHLDTRLPAFMVPTVYVQLPRLPLGRNGKLDRTALPDPTQNPSEHVPPRGDTEIEVARIFAEVLGLPSVSAQTSWFDLGGNSLTATQVIARVNAELRGDLSVRDLFDHPTVRALAPRVSQASTNSPLVPMDRPASIPLAPNQHRMWLLNRFDPTSGAYNIAGAVRLTGTLDAPALVEAVFDVVDRHETLRTYYPDSPSGPHQVVTTSDYLDVRITDTTPDLLDGALLAQGARGFDVTERPPVRVGVFRLSVREHVLLVVTHHIAADGWSMRPLAADVMRFYYARTAGTTPTWAPLPVQYADYTLWTLDSLGSEEDPDSRATTQLGYWREQLGGITDALALPNDHPRPPAASHRGAVVSFTAADRTAAAVAKLASRTGTSQFMVVHAALVVLLGRLSGERDITVGTPVAGRGDRALDDLVGMFVGTLALRTPVDPSASFDDVLQQVRATDLAAYDNTDIPFDRVVEECTAGRSTAHHPLFQVMLSLDEPTPALELDGLTVEPLTAVGAVAKFDLQVSVRTTDLGGTFTYATDLFDHRTVERFAEQYVSILEAVVADPDVIVGDIASPYPSSLKGTPALRRRTLPDALSAAVVSSAGGVALVSGDVGVGYPELDDASTRIARQLIAMGAGPGTSVAIALPRGIAALTMLWAVTKTGAAFVPVDPRYPADRIEHILRDSGAALGVTDGSIPGVVMTGGGSAASGTVMRPGAHLTAPLRRSLTWIHPDQLDPSAGSAFPITDEDRLGALEPEHTAYLIYTSGSTGVPKGVTVTHAGLANLTAELVERLHLDNRSRTLHFASTSFDASVLELLLATGAGGAMHIAAPDVYGGEELAAELAGVTHAFLTPAAAATIDPDLLPDLRVLVVGGEVCGPELLRRWASHVELFNAYGPTEATVAVTLSGPLAPEPPVRIGGPTRGVDVHVLDSRLHPVPEGVVGELYLSGDALARGYHRRPSLTASSFVAHPDGRAGQRLYRTGDRVRVAGNELEYIGRADRQVKVRGFRIELGEIDAVLTRYAGVEQSVSVVLSDTVVSYVVAPTIDGRAVIEHAKSVLPAHMVPRAVTVVESIPLTGSGKIDRDALPEPVFDRSSYVAPRTSSEELVSEVFGAVFELNRVGADEDFFELGGNSLVATRVIARINERARTALPVRALFESPTVGALAAAVDSAETSTLPALRPGPRPARIPLSAAQTRMWMLNQVDPGSAAYNIAFAVDLTGALDTTALSAAVRDVLDRHESLRTVYPDDEGPRQVILGASDVDIDLSPVDVDENSVLGAATAVLGRGFDVTSAVPLRGTLLRVADDRFVLVLVVHHIAADGVSMRPLARDVLAAYTARVHGAPAPWEPLPAQYADFALWQSEVLGSFEDPESVASRQVDYWREALAELPDVLELPTDRPRPAVASQRGAQVGFDIDAATLSAARSLAHRHSASLFMVVNAAYAVLLARLSGTSDIAIGTTVAGRGAGALDDVVGMFVGTLVLRNDIRSSHSFADVLEQVRETNLDALANADVPFEKVVEALRPTRTTSHTPLFQALLALEPERPEAFELPGLAVSEFPYESGVTRFDLALTLTETSNGLHGSLRYSTDLFDETTVSAFAQRFRRILTAAVGNPAIAVGDIAILDAAESQDLTPVRGIPPMPERTFPELVRDAVQSNPDGVALRWKGIDYTYRDADERSTRLARVLLGYGVGPEAVVAVGLPRSVESVLAVWAVIKTGAAYVPVDPAYPPDRLEHMVVDSGAVMGICLGGHRRVLPASITWLELDDADLRADIDSAPDDPIEAHELTGPVAADTRAYMIYTSGSTGAPKGVAVTHRGLANLAESRRRLHRVESSSRFLHNTSPSFDMSVGEMVSALSAAATLVVAPPEILGGDKLTEFVRAERITHTLTTPSTLSTLDPTGLDALEVVCVGGEACSPELLARWAPGRLMLNGYGPTEATDIATLGALTEDAPVDIGAPITGMEALVLDDRLHPVPVGVPGELYLAGPALARGYHGRAGLTGSRFVANPHGDGRMYRTGDIVRWADRHTLRYSGRSDTQVKIRGFRIELSEIDTALSTHPAVDFAVTLGRPGPAGDIVLVSYVLGSAEGIREHARTLLPAYMVPSAIVPIDAVPRTRTGKLDVAALPTPDFGEATRLRRPPSTTTERVVLAQFSEVLHVTELGVEDDFFELGGSSLTALRLLSRLREATGTSVSLQSLLTRPTPESVASLIDSGHATGSSFDIVFPIRTGGTGAPVFCIHPIVGLSWCYTGLDQYTDRPIYGIQTPAPTELPDTLDDLAQRYIDEIDRIAPDEPFHLLGWSLGGTIAHAMAVRLRAQGRTPRSLVLLDSHAVQPDDVWSAELPAADLLDAVGISMPGVEDQRIGLGDLPALAGGSGVIDTHDVERLVDAARHNHELAVRHRPGVYDGDILFVGAAQEERLGFATWHPYVRGNITHFTVPLTHWQMMSPGALRAIGPLVARHFGDRA